MSTSPWACRRVRTASLAVIGALLMVANAADAQSIPKLPRSILNKSLDIRSLEANQRNQQVDCVEAVKSYTAARFGTEQEMSSEALLKMFGEQFGSSSAIVSTSARRVSAHRLNYEACFQPAGDEMPARTQQALVFMTLAFLRPPENIPTPELAWVFDQESRDAFGNYVIHMHQSLRGAPVTGSAATVVMSPRGVVQAVTAKPIVDRELSTVSSVEPDGAGLSEPVALSRVKERLLEDRDPSASGAIVFRGSDGLRPAWRFVFVNRDGAEGDSDGAQDSVSVTVDQRTGATLELSNMPDREQKSEFAASPDRGAGTGVFGPRFFPVDCEPPPCRTSATREYQTESGVRSVTVTASLDKKGTAAIPLTSAAPLEFKNGDDPWYRATVDAYANLWDAIEALHDQLNTLPGAPDRLHTGIEVIVDEDRQIPASLTKGKILIGRLPGMAEPAGSDQDIVAHELIHLVMKERRKSKDGLTSVDRYNCKNAAHVQFPSIDESLADTLGAILGALARQAPKTPDSIGTRALGERARSFRDPSKQAVFNRSTLEVAYRTGVDQFQNTWKVQKYAQPTRFAETINLPCSEQRDFEGLTYLNTGPLNAMAYKLLHDFPSAERPEQFRDDGNWLKLIGQLYISVGANLSCEGDNCDDFCSFRSRLVSYIFNAFAPYGQKLERSVDHFLDQQGFVCT